MGDRPVRHGDLVFEPYPEELERNWRRTVEANAWVLIPGDISDSEPQGGLVKDYRWLDGLPGQKLLSPGNHDHRPWHSQAKIERFCRPFPTLDPVRSGVRFLGVDSKAPGLLIVTCGGACAPDDDWFGGELHRTGSRDPRKRFMAELESLRVSLNELEEHRHPDDRVLVQIHYPPFSNFDQRNPFSTRIERSEVDVCIYGHLHQQEEAGFQGRRCGVEYRVISAPRLGMEPLRLGFLTEAGFQSELLDRP